MMLPPDIIFPILPPMMLPLKIIFLAYRPMMLRPDIILFCLLIDDVAAHYSLFSLPPDDDAT